MTNMPSVSRCIKVKMPLSTWAAGFKEAGNICDLFDRFDLKAVLETA